MIFKGFEKGGSNRYPIQEGNESMPNSKAEIKANVINEIKTHTLDLLV